MPTQYDIAVIGAGLVGSAIAFDLHQAGHKVVVLEAEGEIAAGASRSNSGMLHTGFDSKPGTLETRCIRRQAERWPGILDALGVPYLQPGALLLAKNDEEAERLPAAREQAKINGVEVQLLNKAQTLERSSGAKAVAGMLVPGETITDPYEVVRGLLQGIEVRLNYKVQGAEQVQEGITLWNGGEKIHARWVVNCAGLFADEVTSDGFRITARRGDFIVYPQGSANLLKHILLPMPNEFTKGVLLFPTLYGYLCAGPTAEDVEDKTDWTPKPQAIRGLMIKATEALPALAGQKPVDAWAGLRTVGNPENYHIGFSQTLPSLLHVVGIRSTGLSACLGISEYAIGLLRERGLVHSIGRATQLKPQALPLSQAKPWWQRLNAYRGIDSQRSLDAAGD